MRDTADRLHAVCVLVVLVCGGECGCAALCRAACESAEDANTALVCMQQHKQLAMHVTFLRD